MRKRLAVIIFSIGCYFVTLPVLADGWNYGFKLVYFQVDVPNVDDPDNAGLMVGYDWIKSYGIVGVEGDFSSTFEDGYLGTQAVTIDTASVYATYKTIGASKHGLGYYLKLKGGMVYYDLSVGSTSTDETDTSLGIGLGVNMGKVSFELEYATVEDSKMVNFTVRF